MSALTDMLGKTINKIEGLTVGSDRVRFYATDGSIYMMWHSQDCCESVSIEDVIGTMEDLLDAPILMAEEVTPDEPFDGSEKKDADYSHTWTFYKFATIKGYVTVRWYGSSSGYYSERVDFEKENTHA